jgi:hypothetical protein
MDARGVTRMTASAVLIVTSRSARLGNSPVTWRNWSAQR